jgi:hypothetical protein
MTARKSAKNVQVVRREQSEAAEYIADQTKGLTFLARRAKLPALVYMLEMALREAQFLASNLPPLA